jgi:uncharacterized protein YjbI with pentapeptide repeats
MNNYIYNSNCYYVNFENVLLIDSNVANNNIFYQNTNTKTFPIIYSNNNISFELLNILDNFTTIKTLGIVCHGNQDMLFLNNLSFFDIETINFFISIIRKFNIQTINFLGCNTLQYNSWNEFYNNLKLQTNVIIGASNDDTGNLKYGGDWIMETTNQDVELLYFTDGIKNYNLLLTSQEILSITNVLSTSIKYSITNFVTNVEYHTISINNNMNAGLWDGIIIEFNVNLGNTKKIIGLTPNTTYYIKTFYFDYINTYNYIVSNEVVFTTLNNISELSNSDLSYENLSGFNFSGRSLLNCDLSNITIDSTTILGPVTGTPTLSSGFGIINNFLVGPNANLSNMNLSNWDFSNINLTNVNFKNTNITDIVFNNNTIIGPINDAINTISSTSTIYSIDTVMTDLTTGNYTARASSTLDGYPVYKAFNRITSKNYPPNVPNDNYGWHQNIDHLSYKQDGIAYTNFDIQNSEPVPGYTLNSYTTQPIIGDTIYGEWIDIINSSSPINSNTLKIYVMYSIPIRHPREITICGSNTGENNSWVKIYNSGQNNISYTETDTEMYATFLYPQSSYKYMRLIINRIGPTIELGDFSMLIEVEYLLTTQITTIIEPSVITNINTTRIITNSFNQSYIIAPNANLTNVELTGTNFHNTDLVNTINGPLNNWQVPLTLNQNNSKLGKMTAISSDGIYFAFSDSLTDSYIRIYKNDSLYTSLTLSTQLGSYNSFAMNITNNIITLAIGYPDANNYYGNVNIYTYNNSWSLPYIINNNQSSYTSYSQSIVFCSGTTHLLVSEPFFGSTGRVIIYNNIGSVSSPNYVNLKELNCTSGSSFGYYMCVSGDSSKIIIGGNNISTTLTNATSAPYVNAFVYNNNFNYVSSLISNYNNTPFNICCSHDGSKIAISIPDRINFYDNTNSIYSTIVGNTPNFYYYSKLGMNYLGDRIIIGTSYYDIPKDTNKPLLLTNSYLNGRVEIYDYNTISSSWIANTKIYSSSQDTNYIGSSVGISSNGRSIVIGGNGMNGIFKYLKQSTNLPLNTNMYINTINTNQQFLFVKTEISKSNTQVTNLINNLLNANTIDSSSFISGNNIIAIPQFQQHSTDNTDLIIPNDTTRNQKIREIIVQNKFLSDTTTQTINVTPQNIGLNTSDITTSNLVVANPNITNFSILTSSLTNTTLYCITQLTPQTITINGSTVITFQKKNAISTQTTVTINNGTPTDYNINDTFIAGNMTFKVGSLLGTVNTSGGGSGDPYITTLETGEIYKLAGKIATYRLFHSKNIIINAIVAPIKSDYAKEISRLFDNNDVFEPK